MSHANPHRDAGGEAVLFDVPRMAVKPKPRPKAARPPKPPPPPPPLVLPEPEPHYPVLDGMEEVGSGLLDRFDAMQRVAASAPGGQQLVIAGPGTGKTLVLTTRIAYLVRELGVPAAECLAVAFDSRAADELGVRLTALLGEAAAEVAVTCYDRLPQILWEYADQPGDPDPETLLGLLDTDPLLTDRLHARWPWVFVDDYQDVPEIAYRLLRWLCPPEGNLCAAADPDQAVHTDARYALRFAEDYPDGRTVRLSRSYRSTAPILAAAMQAVAPSSLVHRRFLDPARRDEAPALIGRYAATGADDEADFVARTAGALVTAGLAASDIAVLHRYAPSPESVATALTASGVPVAGGPGARVDADAGVHAPSGAGAGGGAAAESGGGVTLLTLEAAKGREFPVVFLTGCTDGVLPDQPAGADPERLAAERRLLFVGLTRARHRLYVSNQAGGGASRFLESVDDRLFESLNPPAPAGPSAALQLRLL
ncbi:MAG: UvrD-helicase domain-containing protein [Micromonosporaceae bacterium]